MPASEAEEPLHETAERTARPDARGVCALRKGRSPRSSQAWSGAGRNGGLPLRLRQGSATWAQTDRLAHGPTARWPRARAGRDLVRRSPSLDVFRAAAASRHSCDQEPSSPRTGDAAGRPRGAVAASERREPGAGVIAAISGLRPGSVWPNRVPTGPPRGARNRLARSSREFKMPACTPLHHPFRGPGNAVYGVNSYRGFESLSLRQMLRSAQRSSVCAEPGRYCSGSQ